MVTYQDIKHNDEIRCYIEEADKALAALGFTEHSYAHVTKTATNAARILSWLGCSEREVELVRIAGYMHDIGNVINRIDHAQSGAMMTFRILDHLGMPPVEVAKVISAIGNHDESTAAAVNPIAAALILADKTDVRRTRVRNRDLSTFDIHDRVNYAVVESELVLLGEGSDRVVSLKITIDTEICPVMDYFEIFLQRMLLCRKAAEYLGISFSLVINGQHLL